MGRWLSRLVPAGLLAAGFVLASRQAAAQASVVQCEKCHGNREFIENRRGTGRDTSMYVPAARLAETAHGKLKCADCHRGYQDGYPHMASQKVVQCQTCHQQEGADYAESIHAPNAVKTGDAPTCTGCHGYHDVYKSTDRRSPTYPLNVAETCGKCHADPRIIGTYFSTADQATARTAVAQYYKTVHGHALTAAGLTVSATCNDCHRAHKILPADSAESSVNRANIPATCGRCHEGVVETYNQSAHGVALANGTRNASDHPAPVCIDCHSAHGIVRANEPQWHLSVVQECGTCHETLYQTYLETYHGKVTRLGSTLAATCADCHTAHDMRKASDPQSSVNEANVVGTCQKCHPTANASFVQYAPHADPHDRAKNPQLYWTWLFMTILLVGVMGFFGLHTFLWLSRLAIDKLRGHHHEAGDSGTDAGGPPGASS